MAKSSFGARPGAPKRAPASGREKSAARTGTEARVRGRNKPLEPPASSPAAGGRKRGRDASSEPNAELPHRARNKQTSPDSEPESGRRSRKEREVERIRKDILDAAARAFALRGYHATTMEQVAREAGYAVGSLYTYFPGKRELYQSLLQTIADELELVADRRLPGSLTYRQRLEIMLSQQLELIEKNRGFLVSYLARRPGLGADDGHGRGGGGWVDDLYLRNIGRATEQAMAGIKSAELRRLDARNVGYFVVDVVYGAVLRWASGDLEGSLAAHVPVLVDLILNGIGAKKEQRR